MTSGYVIFRMRVFPRSFLREFVDGRTSPGWISDAQRAQRFEFHGDAEEMVDRLKLAGFPCRARLQVFSVASSKSTIELSTGLSGHNLV